MPNLAQPPESFACASRPIRGSPSDPAPTERQWLRTQCDHQVQHEPRGPRTRPAGATGVPTLAAERAAGEPARSSWTTCRRVPADLAAACDGTRGVTPSEGARKRRGGVHAGSLFHYTNYQRIVCAAVSARPQSGGAAGRHRQAPCLDGEPVHLRPTSRAGWWQSCQGRRVHHECATDRRGGVYKGESFSLGEGRVRR